MVTREFARALPVALVVFATLACGKKGALLPPFVRQPAAAQVTDVRRAGNDVYVTVAVPTTDIDGASPASVATIEVWAVTTRTPPSAGVLPRGATLVTTIPVARAAEPGDRSGKVVADPKSGALQGTSVTILDTLTPEELVESAPPLSGEKKPPIPEDVAATPPPVQRLYFTVPRSDRKRVGLLSAFKEVPLSYVPDKVTGVRVGMSGHDVVVQWEPSGGIVGWLLDRPLAPEVPLAPPAAPLAAPPGASTFTPPGARASASAARAAASAPTAAASTSPTVGATRYNVYLELARDPLVLTKPGDAPLPWMVTPLTPLNPQPLTDLTFLHEEVPFDERQRCYRIRAVRGTGAQQVESESSEPACMTPVDLDPPVTPTGLSATPFEGEIQLRWEPNGEEDLLGYIVLRGEAGGDTLQRLTTEPITQTRYTDPTTPEMSGRVYRYVVQAVDNRIPLPNVSDPAEITATAR